MHNDLEFAHLARWVTGGRSSNCAANHDIFGIGVGETPWKREVHQTWPLWKKGGWMRSEKKVRHTVTPASTSLSTSEPRSVPNSSRVSKLHMGMAEKVITINENVRQCVRMFKVFGVSSQQTSQGRDHESWVVWWVSDVCECMGRRFSWLADNMMHHFSMLPVWLSLLSCYFLSLILWHLKWLALLPQCPLIHTVTLSGLSSQIRNPML